MTAESRRFDRQPETAVDTRFFDLREAGYEGPIDQDCYAVPADHPHAQILEYMAERTAARLAAEAADVDGA